MNSAKTEPPGAILWLEGDFAPPMFNALAKPLPRAILRVPDNTAHNHALAGERPASTANIADMRAAFFRVDFLGPRLWTARADAQVADCTSGDKVLATATPQGQ